MNRKLHAGLAVLLVSVFTGGTASACSPHIPAFFIDKPIKVAPDCSFEQAEQEAYDKFLGGKANDIGGGMVGYRWTQQSVCGADIESIVVVDCSSREMISLIGEPHPTIIGNHNTRYRSAKLLYPPNGNLRLTKDISIGELVQLAETEGYDYYTNVIGRIAEMKKRTRMDPYCGCKLFYPKSYGARG